MPEKQKWIVGVDLRERSDGAVRFAAWLRSHTQAATELIGVHAIALETYAEIGRPVDRVHAREKIRLAAERTIERAGARAAFRAIEVLESDRPEEALEAAREVEDADGLIVGRRAAGSGAELIRLGSVARRLLRRLVVPTFVVPPDVEAGQLGEGAVVVAIAPTPASVGAVAVGRSLATATGRGVVFVQVAQVPDLTAPVPGAGSETEALTRSWLAEQGAVGQLDVRKGDALAEVLAAAAEHAAPFLVCGSRQLSGVERVFEVSLSSQLAAQAAIPVLVVPPDAAT